MGDSEEGHSGRYWPRDMRVGDTVSWYQGRNLVYGVIEAISMPRGRIHIFGRKHALLYNKIIGVSKT